VSVLGWKDSFVGNDVGVALNVPATFNMINLFQREPMCIRDTATILAYPRGNFGPIGPLVMSNHGR
jgi:hypothetical protein